MRYRRGMARMARLVVPGHPHHVTQRGGRRMDVFIEPDDYSAYLTLLSEWCGKAGTQILAYCLMPNHVHLILVPSDADGLRAALGETHRRYARHVNSREDWRGHLWQERFRSFPMEESHLLACARYVELNPVRAGLAEKPEAWPWSSTRAHLAGTTDGVIALEPLRSLAPDWRAFLEDGLNDATLDVMRRHGRTGHPLGSEAFLDRLQRTVGRAVRPRRPGRPKKAPMAAGEG